MDLYEFEKKITAERNFSLFCGTDEAGRGPLAGPVFAAAVHLANSRIEGLNDSKKLSEKKREKLFLEICEKSKYSIASASVEEIESLNILEASQLAMRRAVEELQKKVKVELVLVDGNIARNFPIPAICIVGGDGKSASIAAASILAKVSRDRFMREMDITYPDYGFAKHKGYGTKAHYEAIAKYGPSPIHRLSFLKKYYARQTPKPKSTGAIGEDVAFEYLQTKGYSLITRNFRCRYGEIDLIVSDTRFIVFVELKLRDNASFAQATEFVSSHKQKKLHQTAEMWLQENPTLLQPRFDVIGIYIPQSSKSKIEIDHIENAF